MYSVTVVRLTGLTMVVTDSRPFCMTVRRSVWYWVSVRKDVSVKVTTSGCGPSLSFFKYSTSRGLRDTGELAPPAVDTKLGSITVVDSSLTSSRFPTFDFLKSSPEDSTSFSKGTASSDLTDSWLSCSVNPSFKAGVSCTTETASSLKSSEKSPSTPDFTSGISLSSWSLFFPPKTRINSCFLDSGFRNLSVLRIVADFRMGFAENLAARKKTC